MNGGLFGGDAPPLWIGGPNPGGQYSFPHRSRPSESRKNNPTARTGYPIVTGTSVFGVKFDGGVLLSADTLGSYGSLARFTDIDRIIKVNETTIVGCSGDFADFQFLTEIIEQMQIDEDCSSSGLIMQPKGLHCWLTRYLYNKRSKFDPKWTNLIVGGMQEGEPYLGYVSMLGVAYKEEAIATGLGAHIGLPIIRKKMEEKNGTPFTYEEARSVLAHCMKISFMKDCRASDQFKMAVVTKDGAKIEPVSTAVIDWSMAPSIQGYE